LHGLSAIAELLVLRILGDCHVDDFYVLFAEADWAVYDGEIYVSVFSSAGACRLQPIELIVIDVWLMNDIFCNP